MPIFVIFIIAASMCVLCFTLGLVAAVVLRSTDGASLPWTKAFRGASRPHVARAPQIAAAHPYVAPENHVAPHITPQPHIAPQPHVAAPAYVTPQPHVAAPAYVAPQPHVAPRPQVAPLPNGAPIPHVNAPAYVVPQQPEVQSPPAAPVHEVASPPLNIEQWIAPELLAQLEDPAEEEPEALEQEFDEAFEEEFEDEVDEPPVQHAPHDNGHTTAPAPPVPPARMPGKVFLFGDPQPSSDEPQPPPMSVPQHTAIRSIPVSNVRPIQQHSAPARPAAGEIDLLPRHQQHGRDVRRRR